MLRHAALLALFAPSVLAVEPVALAPVVVTATRSAVALADAPAAASVVTREQMDLRNVYRLGDALAAVPGLYVRGSALGDAFPASGVGAISLRGIPRTPRTLVLLDGQPLNYALSGGVNLSGIAMHDVERVEVVRGPYSALYGGHAMGGVIHVITAQPAARDLRVDLGAGGGDVERRGLALAWREKVAGGLGFAFAAAYRRSDGWDGSDPVAKMPLPGTGTLPVTGWQRASTPDGRLAYIVGDKGARPWEQFNASFALHHEKPGTRLAAGVAWSRYRVGATPPRAALRDAAGEPVLRGDARFVDGGSVRLVLAESDFLTQTPSSEEDWRAFARAEVALGGKATLHASAGVLDHAFRFPLPAASATFAAGPGDFFDQPNRRVDADAHVRVALGDTLALTAGGSLNRNTLDRTTWRASYWRDFGTRTSIVATSDGETWNAAAYAEAQWLAAPWLTVYAGGRYDRFTTRGHASQSTPPAFDADYPRRSQDRVSPKLAAVAALGRDATLRLSYGEGFRAPTLLDLYSRTVTPGATAGAPVVTEAAPDLDAERVRAVEAGLDVTWPARTRTAVSLFAQRLSDMIYRERASPALNQLVNVGEARIDGVEVEVSQPLAGDRLRAFATATHLFRYDITRNDAVPASVGKRLTDVPRVLYAAGVEGRAGGWSGSLAWRHAGHAFGSGDDANRNVVQGVFGSYDRHDVVSAKLGYEVAPGATLSIAVENVTGATYFQFYRQPGRSAFVELALRR